MSLQILIADGDVAMALDLHEDGEETQAGIPDDDFFEAAVDDFGVDQRPGIFAREPEKDYALKNTDLGSGYAASVPGFGAPMGESVGEIGDQVPDLRRGWVIDTRAVLPQERVDELQDG